MPTINITLTDAEFDRLCELASHFGNNPASLAEAILRGRLELARTPEEAARFQEAKEYTLAKNAELYRRLASSEAAEKR